MTRKRVVIISIVAVLALLIVSAIVFALLGKDKEAEEQTEPVYSQLTGVEVSEEIANSPILGVIIENSQAARPQTGLGSAGIVFESLTEGGITRYLALYQEDVPEIAGPVRSLRPHFLDWVMGFDASIAHVGGSPEALELVKERDAKSLNQFNYEEPYYREGSRQAPHNMYVRMEDLQNLQADLGHGKSQFAEIPRKSDNPSADLEAENITIDFSSPTYRVEFRYNSSTNTYTRYLAGSPHIDAATNEPITVKNLIVVRAEGQDNRIVATGSGEALVFVDGNVQNVRWEKADPTERIKLLDSEGNEVPLNRGSSWLAVLPENRTVNY